MTTFQIITCIFGFLTLLGGIITVYTKTMVEIAKMQVELNNFRRELNQSEIARLHTEGINREDHKDILKKLDEIILKKC